MAGGAFTSRFSGASGGTDPNAQYLGVVTAYNDSTKEAFVRVGYLGSSMRIKNIVGSAGVTGVPQVGDSVVVSFLNGHINEPVILARINTPTEVAASQVKATDVISDEIVLGGHNISPFNGFRNAIINGDFRINQRGTTSTGSSGTYLADRWFANFFGGSCTHSIVPFTTGSPAATGYEASSYLRLVTSGQTTDPSFGLITTRIEDVRTFANSIITVSFWARCGSGTPKLALGMTQSFGSGGSPSSQVDTYFGQITLTSSWQRFSITGTVPSISGKTIGTTENTSFLQPLLWVSASSAFNSRTGSLGIQNNTFDVWGFQVERGTVATPFEQRPTAIELPMCQRYYYNAGTVFNNYMSMNVNQFGEYLIFPYPVGLRGSPTLSYSFTSNDNTTLASVYVTKNHTGIKVYPVNTGFAYGSFSYGFSVNAEL